MSARVASQPTDWRDGCKARYPLDLDGHAIQCARQEDHQGEHTTAPQGWSDYSTFSFPDQPECWGGEPFVPTDWRDGSCEPEVNTNR